MAKIPTLGYLSRTEAVLGLRKDGLTTREIAARLGIREKTVTALEHSAGRARTKREPEELCRTVLFPVDILAKLAPHAAKRSIHPNSLARLIIEIVVDENLIDAICDDAADLDWSRSGK